MVEPMLLVSVKTSQSLAVAFICLAVGNAVE